jgi:hypothetical protein
LKLFYGMIEQGMGFFRLCGFGLHWKDTRTHRLLFSERNNLGRALRIGAYRFKLLTPWR